MVIKYSKLIKSFVVIYTLDDQYVRNTLIRNEAYNADKICESRSLSLSEAFGWRCAYSIHNFCGKRVEISEDIGDQVIYNVYHGCCSTASNTSTLFGVKELHDISEIGGSIYSIKYYANKIQ